jgi:glycosyltransferase involved in cell wall biosynthesis
MLTGENIICFAKDWSEDPTSNNHVMRLLAKHNRVLWLNSITTRTPSLASGRDLRKILRKLSSISEGARQVDENLWVYTPVVLPFPASPLAAWANVRILKTALSLLRRKLDMPRFQLWSFLPTAAPYFGNLGEELSVYYCTDEFSQFKHVDGNTMRAREEEILRKVDVVFATAHSLLERKKVYNPEAHLASHGVDHAHFAKALGDDITAHAEVASLPRPMLGFFGLLEQWIDQDLLLFLAERHPEWSIVLIGAATADISRLQARPNIHHIPRRPYADLPRYCKAFSVGLIPFALNELTRHVNPIKLREYLSAGLPVVSTALPEVEFYKDVCRIGHSKEEFLAACEAAIAEDSPAARAERSRLMERETWEKKVEQLGDHVLRARAKRAAGASPA